MDPETHRERVFRALHEIAVAVGGVLEPVELARLVVHKARDLFDAGAVGVYAFDEKPQLLQPIYSSDAHDSLPEPSIPLGTGVAGQAVLLGKPVIVDDYTTWPHAGTWSATRGVRSAMAVPLQVADRRTGAVSVRAYTPRQWTDDETQTLTLLAAQIAPVLEGARLHERTRLARIEAEAAIKLRDDVLAGVTHDLAGPLARIRLYAEMIQTESPRLRPLEAAEQIAGWSERIVVGTATMKSMTQELFDVAQLQTGRALQLDQRRTDLVRLVERIVGDHQAAGQRISVEAGSQEIIGWWDEARLARVLGNLLDNALNYSPPGAGVEVLVRAGRDDAVGTSDQGATLCVRDHGPGIPAEELPRVFERFYRGSEASAQRPGSGLGLAVARQIVEQHGGTIAIESQPGAGTVVSLRLPCSPIEAAAR